MCCFYSCVSILLFAVSSRGVASAQKLRANTSTRKVAETKLINEPFNNFPQMEPKSRQEWQKNNFQKNADIKNEQYDYARTVKLVPPSIPECSSGNEFLSIGGRWERSDIVKDKYLYEDFLDEKNRKSCRVDKYNDPYVWAPNCSMPILKTRKKKRIKVAIAGDSLTGQINAASKHLPDMGIDFYKRFDYNPMLTTIKYESDSCTLCDSKLQAKLYGMHIRSFTEEEFLEELSGYDYVFYNEYAHFVGPFMTGAQSLTRIGDPRPLRTYYEEELGEGNITTKEMIKDQLSYFRRQMDRKAELLRERLPDTKVYYRTSPPHALKQVFPDIRKGELYPEPARKISYQECEDHEDQVNTYWGAFCYSVINDIGREVFLSYGHQLLETSAPMSQRTDAHTCSVTSGNTMGDCLHFCMPGPPNVMLAAIVSEVIAREKEKMQQSE